MVDLLKPQPGERILDLGCGEGTLMAVLAVAGCHVIGVDASPAMVAAATKRGLNARVADGHDLPFEQAFDAVFSNAALHWMRQPECVLRGVWRGLKPGGRFVGELGGQGNVATIVQALEAALAARGIDAQALNPWFFPTAAQYRALLVHQGFKAVRVTRFARPTPLPGDVLGWLETFAQAFTGALSEEAREGFLRDVAERCQASGRWIADYVRLRFAAFKPR